MGTAVLKKGLLALSLLSFFSIENAQANPRNNASEDIVPLNSVHPSTLVTFSREETRSLHEDQAPQPVTHYSSQERTPSFISRTRVSYRPAKLHPTPLQSTDRMVNELSGQEIDDNSDSGQENSDEEEVLEPISYTKQLYASDIELASYIQ